MLLQPSLRNKEASNQKRHQWGIKSGTGIRIIRMIRLSYLLGWSILGIAHDMLRRTLGLSLVYIEVYMDQTFHLKSICNFAVSSLLS